MTRRKVIQDIFTARKRRRFHHSGRELFVRLHDVEGAYKKCDPENKELLRYFPIAVVACIESCRAWPAWAFLLPSGTIRKPGKAFSEFNNVSILR